MSGPDAASARLMRWRSLPLVTSVVVFACSSSVTTSDTEVDPTEVPDASAIDTPDPPTVAPADGGTDEGDSASPRPPLPPAGPPVETRPPNAVGQTPAFAEQTRAPSRKADVTFTSRVAASGLENPWAMAFLPDGAILFTERPGRMRIALPSGALSPALAGVPAVYAQGQGGLLDVALDPAFATNGVLYFSYSEPRGGGNGTAVARARLVRESAAGPARLADVVTIWRQAPTVDSDVHFGSRIVVGRDGNLFVTTGERGSQRPQARQLGSALGKVVRIKADGTAPPDNPFLGRQEALPELWSIGHRNMQGAALNPLTGELWVVDHGARGGDEVNIARAGKDYGWSMVTYGIDYDGNPIGDGVTSAPGIEQPVYFWDPSIAPSGMAFYESDRIPAWKGSLFVGALAGTHLVRLTIDGERVVGEERLLEGEGRIRDVRVGPSGTVFVANESKGEIVELVPTP